MLPKKIVFAVGTKTNSGKYPILVSRTPESFGRPFGRKPCFIVHYNCCTIYLRTSLVRDIVIAKKVFQKVFPIVDTIWPNCGDRKSEIKVCGKKWDILLKFNFRHIDIRKRDEKYDKWT